MHPRSMNQKPPARTTSSTSRSTRRSSCPLGPGSLSLPKTGRAASCERSISRTPDGASMATVSAVEISTLTEIDSYLPPL